MNRHVPLQRRTRLLPRRPTKRRSERVEDSAYLEFIRTLPCAGCGNDQGVQAHHAGKHPFGRKASDDTSLPLCADDHDSLHDARGKFADQEYRRRWEALVIEECRGLYQEWQARRRTGMPLSQWALVRFAQAHKTAKEAK